MKIGLIVSILLASAWTMPTWARCKAVGPTRIEVVALLNQRAKEEFVAFLREQPPGTAAGHMIYVKHVSKLDCVADRSNSDRGVVDCRFWAYFHGGRKQHYSTFELANGTWIMVDDKKVN